MSTEPDTDDENAGSIEVANPEMAAAITEDSKEREQEQREEALENESTLQEISRSRSEKTIHLRLEGKRVPFAPPKGALDDVEDLFLDLGGIEEDELTDEQRAQYREGRERVVEILAEKCKDPASSEAYWHSEFSSEERQEILNDLAEGGIEGRDADGFRSE